AHGAASQWVDVSVHLVDGAENVMATLLEESLLLPAGATIREEGEAVMPFAFVGAYAARVEVRRSADGAVLATARSPRGRVGSSGGGVLRVREQRQQAGVHGAAQDCWGAPGVARGERVPLQRVGS